VKKVLTLILATMMALSLTSAAFAGFGPRCCEDEDNGDSYSQNICIRNESIARTGDVFAIGNVSNTNICSSSRNNVGRGFLCGNGIGNGFLWGGCRNNRFLWNGYRAGGFRYGGLPWGGYGDGLDGRFLPGGGIDSRINVENRGDVVAYSGEACSNNIVDNNICTDIRN
jgi:hypothetical protein